MELRVGTSGFSYKEWKGPFYPEDLPAAKMLRFYGSRLPAVEINNTFYRMPRPAVLEGWRQQVPADFRFALKASQRITHRKRLADVADELEYLYRVSAALGEQRGPMLFQLPPFLRKDLPRLLEFLGQLPEDPLAAVEFRHASWLEDEVFEALRAHGVALCVADAGAETDAPLVATAPFGYLRLRRSCYPAADLERWAGAVRSAGWEQAYVFFKHEDAGAGPALAAQFRSLFEARRPRRTGPALARTGSGTAS